MLNFTNSFHLNAKKDKSEILVHFSQVYPNPNYDEGDPTEKGITEENVVSIVMNEETARRLVNSLKKFLEEDISE